MSWEKTRIELIEQARPEFHDYKKCDDLGEHENKTYKPARLAFLRGNRCTGLAHADLLWTGTIESAWSSMAVEG
jgi:hypothetical protein